MLEDEMPILSILASRTGTPTTHYTDSHQGATSQEKTTLAVIATQELKEQENKLLWCNNSFEISQQSHFAKPQQVILGGHD